MPNHAAPRLPSITSLFCIVVVTERIKNFRIFVHFQTKAHAEQHAESPSFVCCVNLSAGPYVLSFVVVVS